MIKKDAECDPPQDTELIADASDEDGCAAAANQMDAKLFLICKKFEATGNGMISSTFTCFVYSKSRLYGNCDTKHNDNGCNLYGFPGKGW